MLLEVILAAVLGTIIYLFLTKTKEEALPIGDGWWAAGQKPDSEEDTTICPFKVVTSEEEIKVRNSFISAYSRTCLASCTYLSMLSER